MNKKQKVVLFTALALIIISIITWQFSGGEIFTKTQIPIERTDDLFGNKYIEWEDKFVLGLDYTGGFIGVTIFTAGLLLLLLRSKKQNAKE